MPYDPKIDQSTFRALFLEDVIDGTFPRAAVAAKVDWEDPKPAISYSSCGKKLKIGIRMDSANHGAWWEKTINTTLPEFSELDRVKYRKLVTPLFEELQAGVVEKIHGELHEFVEGLYATYGARPVNKALSGFSR